MVSLETKHVSNYEELHNLVMPFGGAGGFRNHIRAAAVRYGGRGNLSFGLRAVPPINSDLRVPCAPHLFFEV